MVNKPAIPGIAALTVAISMAMTVLPSPFGCRATADAAGVFAHGEVAGRAAAMFQIVGDETFAAYLDVHRGALRAGAAFPDWGYAFGHGDESEAAHWSPFINAFAAYVRATYPQPWDDETEKLAVFLLGVASHSEADISWHGLGGVRQGFLDVMAQQEFHGDFSAAHTHGDRGIDVMAAYQLDRRWANGEWYVPTADLVAVYRGLGYSRIDQLTLSLYTYLLYVAVQTEQGAAGALFPSFAEASPFLTDHAQDYFVGGMDDMAAWSAHRWTDVIDRMIYGSSRMSFKARTIHRHGREAIDRALSVAREQARARGVDAGYALTERGLTVFSVEPSSGGAARDAGSGAWPGEIDRVLAVTGAEDYGYFGTGLAAGDFDRDGHQDLAVGQPGAHAGKLLQAGAVWVIPGREDLSSAVGASPVSTWASLHLQGSRAFGRFGSSLAVVDLNRDGIDDLAVSAPTTEALARGYLGEVQVFLGRQDGLGLAPDPALKIRSGTTYNSLGWRLAAGDVDDDGHADLFVCSQFAPGGGAQRGEVALFLAAGDFPDRGVVDVEAASWRLSGEADYDWLGADVVVTHGVTGGRGAPIVVVGAPGHNQGSAQNVGRLYGFDGSAIAAPDESLEPFFPEPLFVVTGSSEFDHLGSALGTGDLTGAGSLYLVASVPYRGAGLTTQAGTVAVLPLDELSGERSIDEVAGFSLRGTGKFGRFGAEILVGDWDRDGADDLWVAAPRLKGELGADQGAATFWFGGVAFADAASVVPPVARWQLEGPALRSQLGSALVSLDFDGDGALDTAIGARTESVLGTQRGTVRLVLSPSPRITAVAPERARPGSTQVFAVQGRRLSAEHLAATLVSSDRRLAPIRAVLDSEEQVRLTFELPEDMPAGPYDLTVRTRFGEARAGGAVVIAPDATATVAAR